MNLAFLAIVGIAILFFAVFFYGIKEISNA